MREEFRILELPSRKYLGKRIIEGSGKRDSGRAYSDKLYFSTENYNSFSALPDTDNIIFGDSIMTVGELKKILMEPELILEPVNPSKAHSADRKIYEN